MENIYKKFKDNQEKEYNNFPKFFAFNEEQLIEGMQKLKVNNKNELVSIGYGGFIRKKDLKNYQNLDKKLILDLYNKLATDDNFLYFAFKYELANHEYCINYNPEETLLSLGFTTKILDKPRFKKIFEKAKENYLKNVI